MRTDAARNDPPPVAPVSVPSTGPVAAAPVGLWARLSSSRTFAAFRHRNYRLYFTGQLVSQVGTWMQQVAQGWLMYQLTGSPLYLGLTGFMSAIPAWLLSLGAGVIVDRVPRRPLLIATQTAAMLLAFALSALVFAGIVQPWHILVLALLLGVVNAFDVTARQTFVMDMVGREDLSNAIAMNSALFNLSRILGPALAGITLAAVGPAWCFLLNGISYLAVIYGLAVMVMQRFVPVVRKASMWSQIKEGIAYIRQSETITTLMGVVFVSAIFGFSYTTLLPAYASDVLHVDAEGLGFLSTAVGIGALTGALLVATLSHSKRKGMLLTVGNLLFPAGLLLLAVSPSYPISLLILVFVGLGFMIQQATSNTLVQTHAPDHLRGRVMSVYMLFGFQGMQPIGAIQAGLIAQTFGVPFGIGLGAVICMLFSLFLLWRVPRLRQIE
jgi:MFS family permease